MKSITSHPLRPSGSALLAVMWLIGILSTLVAMTAIMLGEDVETSTTRRQMFRARTLAEQGLALGAHPQIKADDPILRYEVSPGEGYVVEIMGEDGRLNPNVLLQREDRQTLLNITKAWGLRFDEGMILVDSLLDWVDQDPLQRANGAENRFYNTPGVPFNRPFRSIDEMALVRGMDEVERRFPGWRSWFSVHSTGVVDINETTAELLSALTGADIRFASEVISRRLGRDGIRGTKDDLLYPDLVSALRNLNVTAANPQALSQILGVQSSIRRINATGYAGDFSRTLFAVIRGAPGQGGATQLLELNEEHNETAANFSNSGRR